MLVLHSKGQAMFKLETLSHRAENLPMEKNNEVSDFPWLAQKIYISK